MKIEWKGLTSYELDVLNRILHANNVKVKQSQIYFYLNTASEGRYGIIFEVKENAKMR